MRHIPHSSPYMNSDVYEIADDVDGIEISLEKNELDNEQLDSHQTINESNENLINVNINNL